jgi:hypothetical protein
LEDDNKHDNGPDEYLDEALSKDSFGGPIIGFNAIKIFGATKINSCFIFLRLCKSAGIPIDSASISLFQKRGFKSSQFDSREKLHLLFACCQTIEETTSFSVIERLHANLCKIARNCQ